MPEHKFAVGEKVLYSPDVTQDRQSGAGVFEVVRLMPDERVGLSYRIRDVTDGHERIARCPPAANAPATLIPVSVTSC